MLKYQKIAEQLFSFIKSNHLKQGDPLPSLTKLIQEYGASKTTVLKALDQLERDGFIYQVQGSGTFVRDIPDEHFINFNVSHGWTTDFTKTKLDNSDVTVEKTYPTRSVASHLQCAIDTPIFKVQRLKTQDGKIFCFETSNYNTNFVPFLNKEIAKESIFHHISDAYQINVGFSDKYFKVRQLTAFESDKLNLPQGSFGLAVQETFYTTSGEIFDFSENVYHYENATFYI